MDKLASIRPVRWVVLGVLCLSLLGCGLINPRPPRAVVEGAIAQKLTQTQALLYRQLSPDSAPAAAQVTGLRLGDHRWTTLAGQPAVEVTGTYRLTGANLSAAQRRQSRPFDLYLQREADGGDRWFLLNPAGHDAAGIPTRQPIPLD